MPRKILLYLFCSLLLVLPGCHKRTTAQPHRSAASEPVPAKFDVCGLITKEEIEAIEGSPVKETKANARADGGFRVSQCFYTTAEFSRSVSFSITQSDFDSAVKGNPRDFWKQTFGRYEAETKEREGDQEKKESLREQERNKGEEEKSRPPKKIAGIGEDAYWTGNRFGGALYILKKDFFLRVSVGGPDKEEIKIDKSKALAEKALSRL
jgi:hypothetical protein